MRMHFWKVIVYVWTDKGLFTWYQNEFHSGFQFTWYQNKISYQNENFIRIENRNELIPQWLVRGRNFVSVSCKQIQRNIWGWNELVLEWKSFRYHVNGPWSHAFSRAYYLYLLRFLIGSFCFFLLWLATVITLALVLRHSFENRSIGKYRKHFHHFHGVKGWSYTFNITHHCTMLMEVAKWIVYLHY